MAREKLFPEPPGKSRSAKQRMSGFACRLFSTPKEVIDQREAEWQKQQEPHKRLIKKARSKLR